MTDSNPIKILVVDDDPGLLRLIEKALTREGFAAESVLSGGEAIQWLAVHHADLMLLDLKLQDMDGMELIDRLAGDRRAVPFIIITGQGDERVAVEMMKRGALDYLVKDMQFIHFVPTVVRRAMDQLAREKRLAEAEEAVRQGAARLRGTLDSMLEGCQIIGFDWKYSYVNATAARHARRPAEALLGHALLEVFPQIETTEVFAAIRRCMDERIASRMENEFIYPDGSKAVFELSIQPAPEGVFILSNDITERKRAEHRERLQYATTRALAESATLAEAAPKVLRAVCELMDWEFGEFWAMNPDGQSLDFVQACYPSGLASSEFGELTRRTSFARGIGLPGRVWSSARPAWIPDIARDENCPRREAALKLGLRSGFSFPILLNGEVLGAMAFFGATLREPESELAEVFLAIGSQIGQFIERKRLEKELLEISDREQHRIGRDLHDGLGQQLTALEFFSVNLAGDLEKQAPSLVGPMKKIGEQLREAIRQTRAMANGLSPVSLHEGGLPSALQKLADGMSTLARVDCAFHCEAAVEIEDHGTATHLYRIAQEAVNNALKHGRAKKIQIALSKNAGELRLTVRDDGRGFSPLAARGGGMGLRIMKYRANLIGAQFDIWSSPRKGTRVECVIHERFGSSGQLKLHRPNGAAVTQALT